MIETLLATEHSPGESTTSVTLGVITTTVTTLTILGNIATLTTIRKCNTFHHTQKFLISILSGVNLLIGFLHMVFVSIACFHGRWLGMPKDTNVVVENQIPNHNLWCEISSHILRVLIKFSISVVTIISFERFIALKFPFRYQSLTVSRLLVMVLISFSVVIAITVFETTRDHETVYMTPAYQCVPRYTNLQDITLILYLNLIYQAIGHLLVLAVNTYTLIKIIMLNRYARCHLGARADSLRRNVITVTILLVTTLDTLTWLPIYILSLVRNLNPDLLSGMSREEALRLRTVAWWLLYFSPAFNPLIYVFRFRMFRYQIRVKMRGSLEKIASMRRRVSSTGRRLSASLSGRRLSASGSGRTLSAGNRLSSSGRSSSRRLSTIF